jgi:hypothetical protein
LGQNTSTDELNITLRKQKCLLKAIIKLLRTNPFKFPKIQGKGARSWIVNTTIAQWQLTTLKKEDQRTLKGTHGVP